MLTQVFKIKNPYGLHARPSASLSKAANQFQSNITLAYRDHTVDAKSILGLMTLAAPCDSEITLCVDGIDEKQAFQTLSDTINDLLMHAEGNP